MSTRDWVSEEAKRLGLPLAEQEIDEIAVRLRRVKDALRTARDKSPACPEPPYTFVVGEAERTES